MLDEDLAAIYRVTTKQLNQAVRRNRRRFPKDFAFQLSPREAANLRSRIVTSSSGHGGRRYAPFAFSEHGVVMLASVLRSPVAIEASIRIARVFVRFRRLIGAQRELARKVADLEKRMEGHDEDIRGLFETIEELMEPPPETRPRIGFQAE